SEDSRRPEATKHPRIMPLSTGEVESIVTREVSEHLEHHELFDTLPERKLPRLFELLGKLIVVCHGLTRWRKSELGLGREVTIHFGVCPITWRSGIHAEANG